MRIFYDTEFLERGPDQPITLVSIGMVAEDGREYYAVNGDLTEDHLTILRDDPWLGPNVYAHLPQKEVEHTGGLLGVAVGLSTVFDTSHPEVKPRSQIAQEVSAFCKVGLCDFPRDDAGQPTSDGCVVHGSTLAGVQCGPIKAEVWAYYADYDHVVLSQLFGRMIDLPSHMPMYTRDLKQIADFGEVILPAQKDVEHHALADARWVRRAFRNIEYRFLGEGYDL